MPRISTPRQNSSTLSQQIKELSAKNRALESIFENAPYIMMLVDHDGRVVDINRMGVRFTNRNKDELLGLLGGQVFSCLNSFYGEGCGKNIPCKSCPIRTRVTYTLQTGNSIYEGEGQLEIKQNDANIKLDLRVSTTLVESDTEKYVLVTIADNTQHKRADDALRESEKSYRTLADSGRALIWTSGIDKLCNYFNRPWLEFTGRTFDQEVGNGWAEGVYPEDFQYCLHTYINAFDRRENFSMEYRLRFNNGEYRWILDEGCPRYSSNGDFLGYIGYCFDVTERKKGEAELQRSLSELRVLYDNGLATSALLEPHEIGWKLIETLSKNLSWHHIAIRLRDGETDDLNLIAFNQPGLSGQAAIDTERRLRAQICKINQGLSGWSVVTRQTIRVGNVHENPHYIETCQGIHSGMYMPLLIGDRAIGCITVESEQENAFTEQDERLLTTLARQTAIAFENARLYQSVQQELEERQQAERALRESEERFRALFDNSIEGVALHEIVLNKDGEPVNYTFLMANPSFEIHTGLRAADILGKPVTEIYPGIEKTDLIKTYGRVALTGEPASFETYLELTKQFFKVTAYQVGKGRFAAIFENITDRKHAEDSLRQMNERFELATRAADLGVWDWDVQKDKLVWDEKMYAFYGLGKADFGGAYQAWLSGVHPDDRERCDTAISLALSGEKEYDIEFRVIWPSGVIRHLKAYGKLTRSPDGAPLHMIGVNFDITENKQAEEEREMTVRLLQLLNSKNNLDELVHSVTEFIQGWSGCEAVGLRLRQGEDFPYFETQGFPTSFVEQEKKLCVYDLQGQLLRDTHGNPILECMCGNVICGRVNPAKPFFTKKGSFWTNCTTKLLASTTEADRQVRTRNRCNGEGYESVALIPLRTGDQTLGLLQLNDRRRDRFTLAKISLFERLADSLAIAIAQRQTETALHESEYFFKESQRVGFIGSYKNDFVKGRWESSEILDQIFGIERGYDRSIPGWLDIVHPDDQKRMGKYLEEEVIGQHKRFDAEYRIIRKLDHAIRWVHGMGELEFDVRGNVISMIGTIQDITERKLADEALRKSEARMVSAIQATGLCLYEEEGEKRTRRRMAFLDDRMRNLLGIPPDQDYRGRDYWIEHIHPEDLQNIMVAAMRRFEEQGENIVSAEYRYLNNERGVIWFRHVAYALRRNEKGEVIHVIGAVQDITERKLSEEALRTSLAEKEILLKEVHHRVKNNLASINGLIELQLETLSDPAVVSEFNELSGRVHSMALVHELLYQSESLSRIDLNHYFEMLASHIRTSYERSSQVYLHIDANGVEMDLDNAIPCGLIVNELVTNSFKYAFPDGKPRLGQDKCQIDVSAKWDGNVYTLSVSDNGLGMPEGFDWQTSPSLGLQLVTLLGQHQLKGKLELDCSAGTLFSLQFAPKIKKGR